MQPRRPPRGYCDRDNGQMENSLSMNLRISALVSAIVSRLPIPDAERDRVGGEISAGDREGLVPGLSIWTNDTSTQRQRRIARTVFY